jgi:hypothetical protein
VGASLQSACHVQAIQTYSAQTANKRLIACHASLSEHVVKCFKDWLLLLELAQEAAA